MVDLVKKFEKLYDDHVDKIYRFVYLKVESHQAAEDITSLVFTKGWARFKAGQDIANPTAYLYQIARTEVVNHYRSRSRYQTISLEKIEIADAGPSSEEKQQQGAELAKVQKALKGLGEDEQNALIMRYLDGENTKTIATALEKSEGAVRVMLHRALKRLKDTLGEEQSKAV